MNGFRRVQVAAERDGTWSVGGRDFAGSALGVQELISNEHELVLEIAYSGYTVKSAKLWDFSNKIVTNAEDGVASQRLSATDCDKAGRIEAVVLGNSRRF